MSASSSANLVSVWPRVKSRRRRVADLPSLRRRTRLLLILQGSFSWAGEKVGNRLDHWPVSMVQPKGQSTMGGSRILGQASTSLVANSGVAEKISGTRISRDKLTTVINPRCQFTAQIGASVLLPRSRTYSFKRRNTCPPSSINKRSQAMAWAAISKIACSESCCKNLACAIYSGKAQSPHIY